MSLPSGASPWNGIFGRVEGQNTTICHYNSTTYRWLTTLSFYIYCIFFTSYISYCLGGNLGGKDSYHLSRCDSHHIYIYIHTHRLSPSNFSLSLSLSLSLYHTHAHTHTHSPRYIYIHIYIYIYKLVTLVQGVPKVTFSKVSTPRCRGKCYPFPCIAPLYPWTVSYNSEY